ncbi:50S ribosomal protein L34e [Nanoarchaeota archaeon]
MVRGMHKSRTLRKVSRKTPGGKVNIQYKKRNPQQAKCGSCGAKLAGVPRERPHKMKVLPKTKKRPERPFGGVLCTKCTRSTIKAKVRS